MVPKKYQVFNRRELLLAKILNYIYHQHRLEGK